MTEQFLRHESLDLHYLASHCVAPLFILKTTGGRPSTLLAEVRIIARPRRKLQVWPEQVNLTDGKNCDDTIHRAVHRVNARHTAKKLKVGGLSKASKVIKLGQSATLASLCLRPAS